MTDDGDIPGWARPLFDGPLKLDDLTDDDDLTRALSKRLAALLELYQCDASPAGWRALALRLALDHEIGGKPVMKVLTPADREDQVGGAEPGKHFWTAMRLRRTAKELGSTKSAAEAFSKATGISARRLQNIAAEAKAGKLGSPRFMMRWPWEQRINSALAAAADSLEAKSQN